MLRPVRTCLRTYQHKITLHHDLHRKTLQLTRYLLVCASNCPSYICARDVAALAWTGVILSNPVQPCRGGGKGKTQQLYHHRREINLSKCFVVDAPAYGTRSTSFLGENFAILLLISIPGKYVFDVYVYLLSHGTGMCCIFRCFLFLTWKAIPGAWHLLGFFVLFSATTYYTTPRKYLRLVLM